METKNFHPGKTDTDTLVAVSSSKGLQANGNLKRGNTAVFADKIVELTGADLFVLEAEEGHYPDNFLKLQRIARNEIRNNARPSYLGEVPDFSKYATVFIGGPAWYLYWPMINYTFLDNHELNGINIVPFATYVGHAEGIETRLRKEYPQANHLKYLALKGKDAQKMNDNIEGKIRLWLSDLGYL